MNRIVIPLASGSISVTVIRSARSCRMALRLDPVRGAVLVMPRKVALKEGEKFIGQHHDWLIARRHYLEGSPPLADGLMIPLYGKELRLTHCPNAQRGVWYDENGFYVSGRIDHLPRRTLDFLKAEAQRHIIPKVHSLAAQIYPHPITVKIKDTRSRWGSCGVGGKLAFCWRLILSPEWVIDSVITHEVAHLREMNHGPAFWSLVAQLGGDPEPSRVWFKRYGIELLRFGIDRTG